MLTHLILRLKSEYVKMRLMHFLNCHRFIFGWVLLLSLFTHFFVAHHEGVSELILCVQTNGHVVLETPVAHEHVSKTREHPKAEQEHSSHHCEHEGDCDDLHLSFVHPETYLSQNNSAAQDALGLSLATLLASVEFWSLAGPETEILLQQRQAPVFPPSHPPPKQQEQILATTYLLI